MAPNKRKRSKGASASRSNTPDLPSFDDDSATASGASSRQKEERKKKKHKQPRQTPQLVLTSDKRRGVYECDYCHTDISQVPRIRCAVCPDFDLCLDCFATTDHAAAMARLKAAANIHGALSSIEGGGSCSGGSATLTAGVSSAASNHDPSHGYRVCDSTRYPLFPSLRALAKAEDANPIAPIDAMMKSPSRVDSTDTTSENVKDVDKASDTEGNKSSTTIETTKPSETQQQERATEAKHAEIVWLPDDSKTTWTIEEDLRLLDAIKTCGLGNWVDVAEAISGQGSSNKTAKRCMERYFDDFLGRYGHILPQQTIADADVDENAFGNEDDIKSDDGGDDVLMMTSDSGRLLTPKRRRMERLQLQRPSSSNHPRRKVRLAPTASLTDLQSIWPQPYVPPIPHAVMGGDVGRDQSLRAEQNFVKAAVAASSKSEADAIRKEWTEKRLNRLYGPTVLPMRIEDIPTLPGSELAGFMPRRGDFDMEWENNAEDIIADMEFSANDSAQERQLKLQVLEIYNQKLDERERRKQFLLSRGLLDYRKKQQEEAKLPRDELNLIRRMRLFERLHTPEEHEIFLGDVLKAKRLRKEIAKLQMYRRMGIRSLVEAEKYELDKSRREFHKSHQMAKKPQTTVDGGVLGASGSKTGDGSGTGNAKVVSSTSVSVNAPVDKDDPDVTSSLWKQYRTSDRKNRKSINRTTPDKQTGPAQPSPVEPTVQSGTPVTKMDLEKDTPSKQENKTPSSLDKKNEGTMGSTTGQEYLSPRESELCQKLDLDAMTYLEVKKVVIQEAFSKGFLDASSGSNKRTFVKIDVEKKGNIIDFMVLAGWIPPKATVRKIPATNVLPIGDSPKDTEMS